MVGLPRNARLYLTIEPKQMLRPRQLAYLRLKSTFLFCAAPDGHPACSTADVGDRILGPLVEHLSHIREQKPVRHVGIGFTPEAPASAKLRLLRDQLGGRGLLPIDPIHPTHHAVMDRQPMSCLQTTVPHPPPFASHLVQLIIGYSPLEAARDPDENQVVIVPELSGLGGRVGDQRFGSRMANHPSRVGVHYVRLTKAQASRPH